MPKPLLICGKPQFTSATMDSVDPATGAVCGTVCVADAATVTAAVDQAATRWKTSDWPDRKPHERAQVLRNVARLLGERVEILAELQMRDSGKPLYECRKMVTSAAGAFTYFASVLETEETEVTPSRGAYWSMTVLEPYGVVALITPWNSPIQLDALKAAPALAAGNAVVIKPAEQTPLAALELGTICIEAGVPPELITVLNGPGEITGAALVEHPQVNMISFTGGTTTGRAIGRVAAGRMVPAALELGGKSPHAVFADADLDQAIAAVASGIFSSAGQSCVAGSRLFVQQGIYDRFVESLARSARDIRVGLPDDPATQMGPLVTFEHREHVERYITLARQEGGRVLAGGERPSGQALRAGAFVSPTVIDGLSNSSRTCQEEIFGPVIVALPFEDEDDLAAEANDTEFGLACGIWTGDQKKAWRMGRRINAGSVWINCYKESHVSSPFGGFKQSGILREKGRQGLRLYSQIKSMYWGLAEQPGQWGRFYN